MPSKFGTDARMAGSARSSTRMHGKHFWKSRGKFTVAPLDGFFACEYTQRRDGAVQKPWTPL